MSTRCHVVKKENNKYRGIYIHFDGYINHGVGETLYKSYNTEQAVDMLLNMGGFSVLESTLAESDPYSNRGEDCPAVESDKLEDFLDDDYCYLWLDGKYKVYHWDEELGYLEDLVKER